MINTAIPTNNDEIVRTTILSPLTITNENTALIPITQTNSVAGSPSSMSPMRRNKLTVFSPILSKKIKQSDTKIRIREESSDFEFNPRLVSIFLGSFCNF